MEIKESKIVAVNDENEIISIHHEIFENDQEQEEAIEINAYELE